MLRLVRKLRFKLTGYCRACKGRGVRTRYGKDAYSTSYGAVPCSVCK